MPIKDQPSVFLSCIALVVIFFIEPLGILAQNQQGLGPGGRRLTKPDPPSSSTGFGPNTGFGSGSSSSSSDSTGTRCVSIQCADGTVVPCNSSCPRPSTSPSSPSSPSTSGRGGYTGPQSVPAQPSGPGQTDSWREEQARREAEERQRREEFEKSKQSAFKELKGVESTEIGLKGFEKGGELGLKDATDSTALKDINSDPSVVDLTHLDPNKPIIVDPNLPKGKQREFAVQPDKALNNENYIKGFDAIRAGNHNLAVQYFEKAQIELPNDVLVKNGLGLAQELARVHMDEAKKKESTALSLGFKGLTAMIASDYDAAVAYYASAAKHNPRYRDDVTFVRGLKLGKIIAAEEARNTDKKVLREKSGKVLDGAFVAWQRRDYDTSILLLQTALSIDPDNRKIQDTIDFVKEVQNRNSMKQGTNKKSPAKN